MAHKDPDFQAALVMAEVLEDGAIEGPLLICGDPSGHLANVVEGESWARRAGLPGPVAAMPPEGPFGTILLRMPKAAEELRFLLQALAARLAPKGRLYLFGSNDEGIKSAGKGFPDFFETPETLITKRHSRVWASRLVGEAPPPDLSGFQETVRVETGLGPLSWTSWPGMFAHRKLDSGSAFLLDQLPDFAPGERVLDYGCGAGVLSLAALLKEPSLDLTLFDNDALALETALQTVRKVQPEARGVLGTSLGDLGEPGTVRFDLILSNPPIHEGRVQTYRILERLIAEAPDYLSKGGRLRLVTQGTVPVPKWMEASFRSVSPVAENRSFVIWEGRT